MKKLNIALLFTFVLTMSLEARAENFKLVGVVAAGCVVGLVINPYFPTNLLYLKQLFTMALVAYRKFIGIELKKSYFDQAAANLTIAEQKKKEMLLL